MVTAMRLLITVLFLSSLLSGCATNPVTGSSQLSTMSEADEIRIGKSQYGPSQQSQGGPYALDPALNDYVRRVGENLARVSDRPQLPYEFVVLNDSTPNAWALPGGKIALNRGLLLLLDDESELAAVLGHEIVHAAAGHGAQQQTKGTLLNIGLAVLGVATANTGFQNIAMQGAQVGGAMVQSHYGRADELEADEYGIKYMAKAGYDPAGAVRLQERFVQLAAGKRQGGLATLFASHPPSQERVDMNKRHVANYGRGNSGRDAYQRAIARLKRDKPAYDAYDKGVRAMGAGKYPDALAFSREAIKLQEREGAFHELAGYASAQLNRPADAIGSYNRAIARNQNFYRPYVLRGMLHLERGNLDVAQQDFTVSNRLLPTAEATYGLGEIAARQGDVQTAIRYFEPVARSQSPLAPRAQQWIARLQSGSAYVR
jgi:beta-barrel assembly-enhancing protease